MSRITRIFQHLFGGNGPQSDFGQFGSRALGAPVFTKDPNSLQALSAFLTGMRPAINAGNKAPFLEDLNGLFYLLFYQIAYGMQEGVPEWDPSTTYYQFSIVKKPGTFELYGSLTDGNINNVLPTQADNANWHFLSPPSVPSGSIFAVGAGAPFGTLLCDGTAYANGSFPALAAYLGTTWNTYRSASDPGAGMFRVPDLRGQTLIGAGTAPGLTARTLAQFLGEETHILTVGELASHAHGITDPGHRHIDTGNFASGNTGPFGIDGADRAGLGSYSGIAHGTAGLSSTEATGITAQSNGSNGAHNNMQPSSGINWVIKY